VLCLPRAISGGYRLMPIVFGEAIPIAFLWPIGLSQTASSRFYWIPNGAQEGQEANLWPHGSSQIPNGAQEGQKANLWPHGSQKANLWPHGSQKAIRRDRRCDACSFRLIFGEPSVGCVLCSQVPIGL
jgi:hypothetical protein